MKATYVQGNVQAPCPDCGGAVTTFEAQDAAHEYGTVIVNQPQTYKGVGYQRVLYRLMRCAGCQRGGIAKILDQGQVLTGVLTDFYPVSIESAVIPRAVPAGIAAEFREAELCAAHGAWRAASALLRSTLEKALKANGYRAGGLENKINEAAADGVITEARRNRAQQDIRVLGNDVLHDEWREVTEDEVNAAHQYGQRILEDFYDDRASVEAILIARQRIQPPAQP